MRLPAIISGAVDALTGLRSLRIAADRERDAGRSAEAARLYAEALKMAPRRASLRVQRANMLKDSGRFDEAKREYEAVLAQRPFDGDVHLQLGHLHKVRGHRAQAIAHFEAARALAPKRTEALNELALLGERDAQEARFIATLGAPGATPAGVAGASAESLRGQLARLQRAHPDAVANLAFPPAYYDLMRRVWAPPAPPPGNVANCSVLVVVDDWANEPLETLAESLRAQSHEQFQVLLSVEAAASADRARRFAGADPRFEACDAGLDLVAAIGLAKHDLVLLVEPGVWLHPTALAWFGWALANTDARAFVCDTERRSSGAGDAYADAPTLGSVVDHEILLQTNPFGETIAFDRRRCGPAVAAAAGLPRSSGALAMLLELAEASCVGHIPYPLLAVTGAAPASALTPQAYAETVGRHLRRHGAGAEVQVEPAAERGASVTWRPRDASEQIDVVIPSRDNGEDVRALVGSLQALARRPSQLHVTVMDNGTVDPASLSALAQLGSQGVTVCRCDEPFNWSRLSNLGAKASAGPLVVFANDDMSMLTRDWDERLRGLLQRADVGAVGAKLLYPDNTIQHAGILFGWQGKAIHDGLHEPRDAGGPGERWRLRRRVSAVTGAFFAMRRSLFDELGGFDERGLAISYSDLDMSLKVRARGLAVLYAPELELTHYESKSRGLTHLSPAAAAVDAVELQTLEARWPGALEHDVSVNPAWHAATLAFHLLKPPSEEAVLRQLRASARCDPWLPEAGPFDAS